MPGTAIVEVYGAEMVAQELLSAGNRAADMVPMWPRVAERMEQIEKEQYASQGARGPRGPWRDNSLDWSWFKFKHGLSLEVMKATEATYEALTGKTAHSIRDMDFNTLRFGADLPQFAYQQDPPLDAEYPIRYPIDFTQMDVNQIAEMISVYIAGNFSGPSSDPAVPANLFFNPKAMRWQNRTTGKFTKSPF